MAQYFNNGSVAVGSDGTIVVQFARRDPFNQEVSSIVTLVAPISTWEDVGNNIAKAVRGENNPQIVQKQGNA